MTWTYTGTPTQGSVDAVRMLIGDTDIDFQLMQDEDIVYVRTIMTPLYGTDDFQAAALCCDILSTAMAREIDISADGVSVSASALMDRFSQTAIRLRATYERIAGVGAQPYAGGIDAFMPPDLSVKPLVFGMGFMDNFRAGQQNFGNYGESPYYWDRPDPDGGYWTGS